MARRHCRACPGRRRPERGLCFIHAEVMPCPEGATTPHCSILPALHFIGGLFLFECPECQVVYVSGYLQPKPSFTGVYKHMLGGLFRQLGRIGVNQDVWYNSSKGSQQSRNNGCWRQADTKPQVAATTQNAASHLPAPGCALSEGGGGLLPAQSSLAVKQCPTSFPTRR